MYYYLYDAFLNDNKYEKVIDKIKTRLLDLEIQGKHEKLTLLKNVDELVNDEVRRGSKTVIAVGNDKTFLKLIDVCAKNDVTLGIIPVGLDNFIANALGVNEENACEILSARKMVKFDLGKLNDFYFLTNLVIKKSLDRLSVKKDKFKIIPKADCSKIEISNFYYPKQDDYLNKKMKKFSAQDGVFELVIKKSSKPTGWLKKNKSAEIIDTIIQSNKFSIESFEYLPMILDDYKVMKTPIDIEIVRHKLQVIVGKDRLKTIN